jgi:hypothetical protein
MATTRKIKAQYIDGISASINYLDKSTANDLITGWNLYIDSGSRPVDGTGGGTPTNFTWTRTTTDPIQGEGSFLFSKINSTSIQGQGVSYDFTIPRGERGTVQEISFNYEIDTGTYSGGTASTDSDLIGYIYRTTATGRLIEPTIIKLDGAVSGVTYKFRSQFQTDTDATGYRFIIHAATTTTQNFTIKFDNFIVGPSKNVNGAIITPATAYTPTFTGFGSPTSVNFTWARHGNFVFINGTYVNGTPTATEARITLPAGLVSASTLPTLSVVGEWADSTTASTTDFRHRRVLIEPNVGYMTFGVENSTATGSLFKQNGNAISVASATISFFARVQVAGWGATATLGQDADTRVIAARARLTTAQVGVASKVIPFNSITKDTSGSFNSSTGIFTVPVAGQYRVSAGTLIGALDGTTDARLQLRKNSTVVTDAYCTRLTGGSTVLGAAYVSDIFDCVAGDTIDIHILGDASFNIDSDGFRTFVAIDRLAGPSQIAATEHVGLSVNTTSTAIGSALATIVFTNKVLDSHSAYNTSTGVWTCPATATYCIEGAIFVTGTFGSDTRVNCMVRVNSVDTVAALVRTSFNPTGGAGSGIAVTTRRILAGQTVVLQGATQATSPAYSSDITLTYLNITKVGI